MKSEGEHALARATAIARCAHRMIGKEERAARRAVLLRGLESALFGSRMPDARILLSTARWSREPIDAACPRCGTTRARFEHVRGGCAECRHRKLAFCGLVRLGRYAPPLSQWTPAIKQRAWQGMADALGVELGRQVRDAIAAELQPQPSVVTYVPTHWLRRMLRGIDHGRMLAEAVARELGIEVQPLLRVDLLPRQTGSGRRTRASKSGRFRCWGGRRGRLAPQFIDATVLLIDDVRTTGATLAEAADALRAGGAGGVVAACCAAVDPPNRSSGQFGMRVQGR